MAADVCGIPVCLRSIQQKVSIPGPHFCVEKPGDMFTFTCPETGKEYTLTVQEYKAQTLDTGRMPQTMEYQRQYYAMSYTLTPEMSDGLMSLADASTGDRPRRKKQTAGGPAAAVGIIGGADGPTSIIYGHNGNQGRLRAACSSLHFELVEQVEWRMVFHEKQFEDKQIGLME